MRNSHLLTRFCFLAPRGTLRGEGGLEGARSIADVGDEPQHEGEGGGPEDHQTRLDRPVVAQCDDSTDGGHDDDETQCEGVSALPGFRHDHSFPKGVESFGSGEQALKRSIYYYSILLMFFQPACNHIWIFAI